MKTNKQNCKTCKHLNVPPDKSGRIIIRKRFAFECTAEIPMPAFPVSVLLSYGFHWPPSRSYMTGVDGAGCQCYEVRK